jgi:hypothetical protein
VGAVGAVSAFCCHRRVDSEVVRAFARRLREDNVDAWFDGWEIRPGDDIVERIEDGLARSQVALVFLSSTPGEGGHWAGSERSSLVALRLQTPGRRVIPVLVDPDAEVPPLLQALDHRSIDDYDDIRDAILGVSRKPRLGMPSSPPPTDPGRPPPPVGRHRPSKQVLLAVALGLGLVGALLLLVPLAADDRPESRSPDTTDPDTEAGDTVDPGDPDPDANPDGSIPSTSTTSPSLPSCPDHPTPATFMVGTFDGRRLVEVSYDLDHGKQMSFSLRAQMTGELGADEELRVFREEQAGSFSSTVPPGAGRANQYSMSDPYSVEGSGCWGHTTRPLGYDCAAGLDFRFHVAAVDRAEAARLDALPGSDTDGLPSSEVFNNPKVQFFGTFGIPTENIADCPNT